MTAAYSVGGWSFHGLFNEGKINLYGYLESMKYRYRLQHADIWTGMLLSTEDAYIRQVKATLDEEGLIVASLNVDGADVWHDDPAIREQNHQKALRYLEIARLWGAKNLRIDLGINAQEITDEQFEFSVKRYQEYTQFAQDNGFTVGPQTHQPSTLVPANVKKLNDAVASPAFGILLNVSRWLVDKEIGDEMVAPFTSHVQLDRAFVNFYGEDLLNKMRTLRRGGYHGIWSLEYRGGKNEYLEIEQDILTLRRAVRQALGEY